MDELLWKEVISGTEFDPGEEYEIVYVQNENLAYDRYCVVKGAVMVAEFMTTEEVFEVVGTKSYIAIANYEAAPEELPSGYCGAEGEGTNLEWNITADGTLVISGEGAMRDFDFDFDNDKPATPWYEYRDEIKGLVLEEGITTIGGWAFCGLTGLAGTELVLPDSIEEIGNYAFRTCGFVGELNLPANLKVVKDAAFEHAGRFTGTLVIPAGTEKIGRGAIRDGYFTEIIVPASVTEIGISPFPYNSYLKEIAVAEENANYCDVDGVLLSKDKTELIQFPAGRTESYTTPESVTVIKENAFGGAAWTSAIYIHENVKTVEALNYSSDFIKFVFMGVPETFVGTVLREGMVVFMNGAPANVVAATENNPTFGKGVKLYYLAGTENLWNFDENGKWNGYTVEEYKEEVDMTISSAVAAEEGTAKIKVSIGKLSFAKLLQFAIKYDASKLELLSCTVGGEVSDATVNDENAGIIYFAWDSYSALTDETDILELEFKALPGTKGEEIEIDFDKTEKFIVAKNHTEDIDVTTEGGTITVVSPVYGDLNGDGSVDIKDAYVARMIAAKLYTPSVEEMINGDVDGDGKINVIDANLIRKYCVKKISKFPVEQ